MEEIANRFQQKALTIKVFPNLYVGKANQTEADRSFQTIEEKKRGEGTIWGWMIE
jgi:hypothetical protein